MLRHRTSGAYTYPMDSIVTTWLLVDEWIGAALGVLVVLCLIREKLWAWPLGVAYVLVSITPLLEAKLYANLALHIVGFLPLNLYGWYHWLFGGEERDDLPVTRVGSGTAILLAALCMVVALTLGWYFATNTDAAFPYWDNAVFAMSLAAMWLTARKYIENWLVWFVVNIISVALYFSQELYPYAFLYGLYIPMAVWGYISWLRSMGRRA